MDCSICYEGISGETGQAILSCSHSFHIRCLIKWFDSQTEKELTETCPCCRHEATHYEKLPEADAPSEIEDEVDTARIDLARDLFSDIRAILTPEGFEFYAATRIQAVLRGYWSRQLFTQIRNAEANIVRANNNIRESTNISNFYKKGLKLSRTSWKIYATTMIQAAWRGYKVRKARRWQVPNLHIRWTMVGGIWTRTVSFPSDLTRGLPPQSVAFQQAISARRIQALWRGYYLRKSMRYTGKRPRLD